MTDKPTYMDVIREMTEKGASNAHIARILCKRGYRTPRGKAWTARSVSKYRNKPLNANDLYQCREAMPVDDIYPYVVPLGTDFYCEAPGQRRYGHGVNL